jgi:hypothetical protein
MADKYEKSHQEDHVGLEIKADWFTGQFNGSVIDPDVAAIVNLTDSSGGASGGNTVPSVPAATAATTDTTAASLTSTNAAITAIKNDVATLAAKLNALLTALK